MRHNNDLSRAWCPQIKNILGAYEIEIAFGNMNP